MEFLVPNYSCLQNPWLGGLPPPDPHSLCPLSTTEFVETPPRTKFLGMPMEVIHIWYSFILQPYIVHCTQQSVLFNWNPHCHTELTKELSHCVCRTGNFNHNNDSVLLNSWMCGPPYPLAYGLLNPRFMLQLQHHSIWLPTARHTPFGQKGCIFNGEALSCSSS
jgi:hypothetical protein